MSNSCLSVADIRDVIKSYLHCHIQLEAHRSKKKIYQKEGIIKEAYTNIFIIEIIDSEGNTSRLSFSYTDLLTKNVKVVLQNAQNDILDQLNAD